MTDEQKTETMSEELVPPNSVFFRDAVLEQKGDAV